MWEASGRSIPEDAVVALYGEEYDRLIAQGRQVEPDVSRWMTGGRTKGADDIERRRGRGAGQLRAYLAYARTAPERVLAIGGGEVAAEVAFSLNLGGVEVIGYIDEVIEWPNGEIGPRDLKTGSKRPDWPFQLGVYRWAVHELFGVLPTWGDYYMAKDGKPDPPVDLRPFTRARLERWFRDMDRAVRTGLFLPNPGDQCRTCGVAAFCSARGSRADEYPPMEVDA